MPLFRPMADSRPVALPFNAGCNKKSFHLNPEKNISLEPWLSEA